MPSSKLPPLEYEGKEPLEQPLLKQPLEPLPPSIEHLPAAALLVGWLPRGLRRSIHLLLQRYDRKDQSLVKLYEAIRQWWALTDRPPLAEYLKSQGFPFHSQRQRLHKLWNACLHALAIYYARQPWSFTRDFVFLAVMYPILEHVTLPEVVDRVLSKTSFGSAQPHSTFPPDILYRRFFRTWLVVTVRPPVHVLYPDKFFSYMQAFSQELLGIAYAMLAHMAVIAYPKIGTRVGYPYSEAELRKWLWHLYYWLRLRPVFRADPELSQVFHFYRKLALVYLGQITGYLPGWFGIPPSFVGELPRQMRWGKLPPARMSSHQLIHILASQYLVWHPWIPAAMVLYDWRRKILPVLQACVEPYLEVALNREDCWSPLVSWYATRFRFGPIMHAFHEGDWDSYFAQLKQFQSLLTDKWQYFPTISGWYYRIHILQAVYHLFCGDDERFWATFMELHQKSNRVAIRILQTVMALLEGKTPALEGVLIQWQSYCKRLEKYQEDIPVLVQKIMEGLRIACQIEKPSERYREFLWQFLEEVERLFQEDMITFQRFSYSQFPLVLRWRLENPRGGVPPARWIQQQWARFTPWHSWQARLKAMLKEIDREVRARGKRVSFVHPLNAIPSSVSDAKPRKSTVS